MSGWSECRSAAGLRVRRWSCGRNFEPACPRFAGATVSVPVTATNWLVLLEEPALFPRHSGARRSREPGIQLAAEGGFRAPAFGRPRNDSGVLVRVGGFEPPVFCFQGRWGRPGSPTPCRGRPSRPHPRPRPGRRDARMRARALGHPAGLEPAAFGFARRRSHSAELWVDGCAAGGARPAQRIGFPTTTRTWIRRLTTGCPAIGRSGNGGDTGSRTRRGDLAKIACSPLLSPSWCLELVSSQPLRVFGAALSPDQLPRQSLLGASELVRTRRIELLSPEWRSGIEPINYVRGWFVFGASPRIRTSRRPTCRFHRRRFYGPVAGQGRKDFGAIELAEG